MEIREEISKDLERIIQSDVSDFTDETLNGNDGERDLDNIKSMVDLVHKLKMDSLEEQRKEIDLEKAKLEYAESKKKFDNDEAEKLIKAEDKTKSEKKQRCLEIIWKAIDYGVKLIGIALPVFCSVKMFNASMKMEYIDNGVTPKPAKDLWSKMLNKH